MPPRALETILAANSAEDRGALNFEAVYDVLDADYNIHMDIHQAVLLDLLRRLREQNIEIAFPTRTLHVEHDMTEEIAARAAGNPERIT